MSSSICEAASLWPQVKNPSGADQTEANAGFDERKQHRGREARKGQRVIGVFAMRRIRGDNRAVPAGQHLEFEDA
jgi:hypothetical protein